MKKIGIIFTGIVFTLLGAAFFYSKSTTQAEYQGIATVPCLDPTKEIVEDYTLSIEIRIFGKKYPLDKNIGHDYGNCLRAIHTSDTSKNIHIQSNTQDQYTLGQFFDVWHKKFTEEQIFDYQTDNSHTIQILVNGETANTYRQTPLNANDKIEVIYK